MEDVWKRSMTSRYDQRSTRKGHYGLSLRRVPPAHPYEMIPLLHGTSGAKGPVVATGLSSVKPADYPTSFGHLAPVDLNLGDFGKRNIKRNSYKPKLNDREMESLDEWMRRQGPS